MLDPSTVLSKVGSDPLRVSLTPATPDLIVDGGSAGASVATLGGAPLTATIDNTFTPGAYAAAATPQAVAAGSRRAFKLTGNSHIPLVISWS